jgi:glutamyl/glutaminyl-tRNA synthetase
MEISQNYRISETKEEINFDYLKKIISIYQERLKKLSEISELTDFFFKDKLAYEKELLKWKGMTDEEVFQSLDKLEKILSEIKLESFIKENLNKIILPEAEKYGKMGDRGYLLWPLRAALSGKKASPDPLEIAEILGKEKTLKRIKEAKEIIKNKTE